MRVVVTGAAGLIGREVADGLVTAGHEVVGCDLRPPPAARFAFELVDLVAGDARARLARICEGADALVHLANRSDLEHASCFADNAAADDAVFDAVLAAHVPLVCFASSMLVMNGRETFAFTARPYRVAYLPLDGRVPARVAPGNGYARAKLRAERALAELARRFPERRFVVLRLPTVVTEPAGITPERAATLGHEGFAFLPLCEVAPLMRAVLEPTAGRKAPTGLSSYFPTARENAWFLPAWLVALRHYPGVSWRGARGSLVDLDVLARELGWRPRPVPPPRAVQALRRAGLFGSAAARPLARVARVVAAARRPRDGDVTAPGGWSEIGVARLAIPTATEFGESPRWSAADRCLYLVDLARAELVRCCRVGGAVTRIPLPGRASAVWIDPEARAGREPRLIVALDETLVRLDVATGVVEPHAVGRFERWPNRLNDGVVDPLDGHLWVGSIERGMRRPSGALFRVAPDGRVTRLLEHLHGTNGMALTPDGSTLYLADSIARTVVAYPVERREGDEVRLGAGHAVLTIPPGMGMPDGLARAPDGRLLVALLGAGRVALVWPEGGRVTSIRVPTVRVTSCELAGHTLYITSARAADPLARLRDPLGGHVFAFDLRAGPSAGHAHGLA